MVEETNQEVKSDVKESAGSAEDKSAAKSTRTSSGSETARYAEEREKIEELLQVNLDPVVKAEVSASTVVKMMGLATASELKLIEGKIDLLAGRLGNFSIRLERVMNQLNNIPSASDFERLEAALGSVKSMIKEMALRSSPDNSSEKGTKEKLQAYLSKNQSSTDSGVEAKPDPTVKSETPSAKVEEQKAPEVKK